MKANSTPSRGRAFTLIELMVVVGIIAALAALVMSVAGRAKESGRKSRAKAEIKAMGEAMEAYKVEYGDYPEVANKSDNPEDMARMLYQALSGDGSSAIEGGEGANSRGEIGASSKVNMDSLNKGQSVGMVDDKKWLLKDPWGNPYRYIKGSPEKTDINNKNTFDLWSIGGDKTGKSPEKWVSNWE